MVGQPREDITGLAEKGKICKTDSLQVQTRPPTRQLFLTSQVGQSFDWLAQCTGIAFFHIPTALITQSLPRVYPERRCIAGDSEFMPLPWGNTTGSVEFTGIVCLFSWDSLVLRPAYGGEEVPRVLVDGSVFRACHIARPLRGWRLGSHMGKETKHLHVDARI